MIAQPPVQYDIAPFLEFVEKTTGMTVPDTNYRTLRDAIARRISELGTDTIRYLRDMEIDAGERERFLNLATINETYFFREHRHFLLIRKLILPELAARYTSLALWSVTCSSGEEALSLAMIAGECCAGRDYRVFASDINTDSLKKLEEGTYYANSLRGEGGIFMPLMRKYSRHSGKAWRIDSDLRSRVIPVHLNISQGHLEAIPDGIHLALLRNTLIYMKADVKERILHSIAGKIADGGYLFLSSAEIPHLSHRDLVLRECEGVYFFQKRRAAPPAVAVAVPDSSPARACSQAGESTALTSPDKEAVLRYAALLSEGNISPESSDRASLLTAELILYALHFINALKFDLAEELLSVIGKYFSNEITDYLAGFLEMLAGRDERARLHFAEALRRNRKFWPARFYLAVILRNAGDKSAVAEFAACRDDIESGNTPGSPRYRFLLEQFSEQYFAELCTHWIETLKM